MTLKANDADEGINGQLEYAIVSGDPVSTLFFICFWNFLSDSNLTIEVLVCFSRLEKTLKLMGFEYIWIALQ